MTRFIHFVTQRFLNKPRLGISEVTVANLSKMGDFEFVRLKGQKRLKCQFILTSKRHQKIRKSDRRSSERPHWPHYNMAETSAVPIDCKDLPSIRHLLWGDEIKPDIFKRWSQGFYFSENEPSALEQTEGGPCAIIAPVQAFIIKNLLLEHNDLSFRENVTSEIQNRCLVNALSEILELCNVPKYYVVYLSSDFKVLPAASDSNENDLGSEAPEITGPIVNPNRFHEHLKVSIFNSIEEVRKFYCEHIESLKEQYGILLFLYTVICSRGLKKVKEESDTQEPLIDKIYGYGSQALINLMITGRATTYVWDNDQEIQGLKLKGIEKQSQVGFITIMEYLRYCTVGSYYKNPVHPVWVLASDTHLTVLFSDEKKLVSPETKSEQARRIFKKYETEGNNFIKSDSLQDVLTDLELFSDPEYVDLMKKKLDSENLGIILLNAFMDEFFPKEETSTPDMFTLIHYNGLPRSNVSGKVQYHIGSAILLESDMKAVCESDPVLTVLQTKWPNIEVNWCDGIKPSLN